MMNGCLVRYLDFMDNYLRVGEVCHPADNFAAVLAATEDAGASGAGFLTALAVAYHVQARHALDRNLVPSGVCGTAVAASLLLSRALEMPKSYWAPMTTLIVLKADYRSVGRRGLWRLVGTLVGGALAGALGFAHLGTPALLTLTIVLLFVTYALHNAHYGLFVGVMTAWLVVMLGLGQHFEASVAWHRAVFTVLGGVLAIAVEMPRAAAGRLRRRTSGA